MIGSVARIELFGAEGGMHRPPHPAPRYGTAPAELEVDLAGNTAPMTLGGVDPDIPVTVRPPGHDPAATVPHGTQTAESGSVS
jgi:hypothetical protein